MKTFWTREILQASIASLLAITLFVSVFDGVTQLALAAEMKQNRRNITFHFALKNTIGILIVDYYSDVRASF